MIKYLNINNNNIMMHLTPQKKGYKTKRENEKKKRKTFQLYQKV